MSEEKIIWDPEHDTYSGRYRIEIARVYRNGGAAVWTVYAHSNSLDAALNTAENTRLQNRGVRTRVIDTAPLTKETEGTDWMTTDQVSDYLHVDSRTLQRWRNTTTDGPPHHKYQQTVRYNREEVDQWLLQR